MNDSTEGRWEVMRLQNHFGAVSLGFSFFYLYAGEGRCWTVRFMKVKIRAYGTHAVMPTSMCGPFFSLSTSFVVLLATKPTSLLWSSGGGGKGGPSGPFVLSSELFSQPAL